MNSKRNNKMTKQERPEGWEDTLDDLIRANFNYENTNLALKKKYGSIGAVGGDMYRERKINLVGGNKVDGKLDDLGERKQVKKQPKASSPWSKSKQQAADNSKLAQIVNMGIYQGMVPFCESKQLREENVQEINPGGAIVANINYYFPETKLDHPLVLLGVRMVILYVKFKSLCGNVRQRSVRQPGVQQGLKPGIKTDIRK